MLTSCPECHGQVSDQATVCPHCGYEFQKASPAKSASWGRLSPLRLFLIIFGAVILGGVVLIYGIGVYRQVAEEQRREQDAAYIEKSISIGDYYYNRGMRAVRGTVRNEGGKSVICHVAMTIGGSFGPELGSTVVSLAPYQTEIFTIPVVTNVDIAKKDGRLFYGKEPAEVVVTRGSVFE